MNNWYESSKRVGFNYKLQVFPPTPQLKAYKTQNARVLLFFLSLFCYFFMYAHYISVITEREVAQLQNRL